MRTWQFQPKAAYWRFVCSLLAILCAADSRAADGQLELTIVDSESNQRIPVRVEMTDPRGRAVKNKKLGVGFLGEHFYLPGYAQLSLRRGAYRFLLDAGPEYRTQNGHFEIERHADDTNQVAMRRFATLPDEGWWAGDFDLQRELVDLPLMAAAEGLHFAPSTRWIFADGQWEPTRVARKPVDQDDPNLIGRQLGPMVARVESAGGTLLIVASEPLDESPLTINANSSTLEILKQAEQQGLRVVAATPTAWYLPVWIASGQLDAVTLITRQSEWKRGNDRDPDGKPRDKTFYPGKQGLARWGQAIYFHLLNAGVQIPPVAGSGSGATDSPLGTNRTYVSLPDDFSPTAWWEGISRGATVVTNGPLLRPSVGGEPPGAVFHVDQGPPDGSQAVDFQIALNLASRDAVDYLEVLKNGEVATEVRLSDWAKQGGKLPPASFDSSGWFAIRAVTRNTDKYQYALTAPYYVQSPAGPRVSRASVEFFLAWLGELESQAEKFPELSADELAMARTFWQTKLQQATAP